MMGSGGLIVMDEDNCMVDIAKFYLEFIVDESCGKCSPCRIGTKRLLDLLTKITEGNGEPEDLDTIEELCEHIKQSALCGLGQNRSQPGALHPEAFPGGVRGPCVRKALPRRGVQGPDPVHGGPHQVQGLHPLRPGLSHRRHLRRGAGPPYHQPVQVHQVRRLHGPLPL